MKRVFRFIDWPLRAKIAALLLAASVLPLSLAAFLDIYQARQRVLQSISGLLEARAEHLVDNLDDLHRAYLRNLDLFTKLPEVAAFCSVPITKPAAKLGVDAIFDTYRATDTNLHGLLILDTNGIVRASSGQSLIGKDLSYRNYVRAAIAGDRGISEVHFSEAESKSAPVIAYITPVTGIDGAKAAIAIMRLHAKAIWEILAETNGPDNVLITAVLFDSHGVCIGDTSGPERVFHPAGQLDPSLNEALAAEG